MEDSGLGSLGLGSGEHPSMSDGEGVRGEGKRGVIEHGRGVRWRGVPHCRSLKRSDARTGTVAKKSSVASKV